MRKLIDILWGDPRGGDGSEPWHQWALAKPTGAGGIYSGMALPTEKARVSTCLVRALLLTPDDVHPCMHA